MDFSCFWLCGYVMEFLLQLTEDWGEQLFSTLSKAGGKAFSNMAVGYNNVDVDAANKYGVAVGMSFGHFGVFSSMLGRW